MTIAGLSSVGLPFLGALDRLAEFAATVPPP
jgi:hypothetical protein